MAGKTTGQLTPKEEEAYNLKHVEKMRQSDIAKRMGVAYGTAAYYISCAERKLGRPTGAPSSGKGPKRIEEKDPEAFATVVDIASHPDERMRGVERACREAGLTEIVTQAIIKRVSSQLMDVREEIQEVKISDMLGLFEDRAKKIVDSIDFDDIKGASLKDRAIAAGIFWDKAQVLRGQPTSIMAIDDRRELREVMQDFLKEASRRGFLEVDITPEGGVTIERRNNLNDPDGKEVKKLDQSST